MCSGFHNYTGGSPNVRKKTGHLPGQAKLGVRLFRNQIPTPRAAVQTRRIQPVGQIFLNFTVRVKLWHPEYELDVFNLFNAWCRLDLWEWSVIWGGFGAKCYRGHERIELDWLSFCYKQLVVIRHLHAHHCLSFKTSTFNCLHIAEGFVLNRELWTVFFSRHVDAGKSAVQTHKSPTKFPQMGHIHVFVINFWYSQVFLFPHFLLSPRHFLQNAFLS
jgi:hypothetical protein